MSREFTKQRYYHMWHDCDSRQPDKEGLYLTVDEKGFYEVLIWNGEWRNYLFIAKDIEQQTIVAWMPFEEWSE